MPSKGKKPSRASPATTHLDRSPLHPRTLTVPSRGAPAEDDQEALHRRLISAAAAKFPFLISDSRTFCARVSDKESSPSNGNHARVWLSSAAMISNSIAPGSIVSVSLPAYGKAYMSSLPLHILSEECASLFSFDIEHMTSSAGSYFAIASVFPSNKVLKDGVRLSWGLSCTVGSPELGRTVFICPIDQTSVASQPNNSDTGATSYFFKCKDLHLNLVFPETGNFNRSKGITTSIYGLKSVCPPTGNWEAASPETPQQNKLSSPAESATNKIKSNKIISTSDSISGLDASSIKLALEDEKVKELMQMYAARWLRGRHLINGNFVCVPICGQYCVFLVAGFGMLPDGHSFEELIPEKSGFLPIEISRSSSLNKINAILVVDSTTKVHLSDSKLLKQEFSSEACSMDTCVSSSIESIKESGFIPKLGGLYKEFEALKEIMLSSFGDEYSLSRYKGVLLHGPPGTGKTSLAISCAHVAGASLLSINGPEIISENYGESEQALRGVFESAREAAPSVVFIDELDAIAPAREEGSEELSLRMVGTILKLMDEISSNDRVLVIAATNRLDSIDPALRRWGRFDREIEIGVPSSEQRLDILCTILNEMTHSLSSMEIQALALSTHGFVGADLAALCNEAGMMALRRYIKAEIEEQVDSISSSLSALNMSPEQFSPVSDPNPQETCVRQNWPYISNDPEDILLLEVATEDFEKAKMKVRPSAMREVTLELPKVSWDDVGGQTMIKKQLIEAVQWPQICPDAFKRLGTRPPRSLLMIGPPGCSKTLMARAVASEAKLNFLAVKGPELFRKWVGESEKAVRAIFAKARANSPAIVFFDEIDGLAVTRGQDGDSASVADRVLNQFLIEMDGLTQTSGVTVIAATNRPDKIDPALLRPGRFDRLLDVQPPDETDRVEIFRIYTRKIPCSPDVNVKDLAQLTEGYTGADIKLACREAAIAALEQSLEIAEVSMNHFKVGISRVQPCDLKFYSELALQFRRLVDSQSTRGGVQFMQPLEQLKSLEQLCNSARSYRDEMNNA